MLKKSFSDLFLIFEKANKTKKKLFYNIFVTVKLSTILYDST